MTYRIPDVNGRPAQVVDSGIYCDVRFDANDSAPIYVGMHQTSGASEDDTNWKIAKHTYSGSDVTRIQIAYGSWTNRASLF